MPYCCLITSLLLHLLQAVQCPFPSTGNILALGFQTKFLSQVLIPTKLVVQFDGAKNWHSARF
jgi:hypothetical protein